MDQAAFNRELGFKINHDIWNGRRYDLIPEYFAEDFVADYTPYGITRGRDNIQGMVERAHATFEHFQETVHSVTADAERIVVHFTISGRQTGAWGPVPPSGKEVSFDEIVIMTVRDGKVVRQIGIVDNLRGLRQVGVLPTPPGMSA